MRPPATPVLQQFAEQTVPINGDAGDGSEWCLSFQLEKRRASVMTCFQAVDTHSAINGLDEPNFAHSSTFVNRKFDAPIMIGGTWGYYFSQPVGGTPHTTRVELLKVGNDEDIGLQHGVNLVIVFGGPG